MDSTIAINKQQQKAVIGRKRKVDEISFASNNGLQTEDSIIETQHRYSTRSKQSKTNNSTGVQMQLPKQKSKAATKKEGDEVDKMLDSDIPIKTIEIQKPILNYDILQEIFSKLEFLDYSSEGISKLDENDFTNFMLASKQTMDYGLSYFRYPMIVTIYSTTIDLRIKYSVGKTKDFYINFESPLLKLILPVIASSMEYLKLQYNCSSKNHWWYKNFKDNGCEKLFAGNFKTLEFYNPETNMLNEYKKILMKNSSIQTISNVQLDDFPFIPPSCRELKFSKLKGSLPENLNYSKIEKFLLSHEDFSPKKIQIYNNLIAFIAEHFNNLKYLEIHLEYKSFNYYESSFAEIFEMKNNIKFSSKVAKGIIRFSANNCKEYTHSNARAKVEEDMKVEESNKQIIVTKEFEIHDGLEFKFSATFCKPYKNPSSNR